jgi:hypothetical protein
MTIRMLTLGLMTVLALAGNFLAPLPVHAESMPPDAVRDSGQWASDYGQLPLSFEPNRGQADSQVKFISRGTGHSLSLSPEGAVLDLSKPVSGAMPSHSPGGNQNARVGKVRIQMTLAESNPSPSISGDDVLPGTTSYFIGRDPSQWLTSIPTYARVQYEGVYPGIDLVYHGNHRQLEFDFVVAPAADPGAITLSFTGIDGMRLDSDGNLLLRVGQGELPQQRPVSYQDVGGVRREVASRYVLLGRNSVGIELDSYDRTHTLVIDPVLAYSTYYGGTGNDIGNGIAVDGLGNIYVIGSTNVGTSNNRLFVSKINAAGTTELYTAQVYRPECDSLGGGIAVDTAGNAYLAGVYGDVDQFNLCNVNGAFTAKLNPAGTAFIYSYATGTNDRANAVAVDSAGNAYFTGVARGDWPVTPGAFQTTPGAFGDAFVLKLDPTGNILYSTYLGGGADDEGYGIAVDAQQNAVVAGSAASTLDFPTTANAFSQTAGNPTVTCFATKLNAAGSGLLYSTFLGGAQGEQCSAVALDGTGKIYVTGSTNSFNFPIVPAGTAYDTTCGTDGLCNEVFACSGTICDWQYAEDVFVAKIDPTLSGGASLVYSTFIGAENRDLSESIAVNASNVAFVTGRTASSFFPVVNALQASSGGVYDVFVTAVNPTGTGVTFSTYLGGTGVDEGRAIARDAAGNIYLTGDTTSTAFPTRNPLRGTILGASDAFITKIDTVATTDTDSDGVGDTTDNCKLVANANQRDTNGDGYGNICDPDFNGDGTVNINDFNRLKARLNITPVVDIDTDLDGNGAVNINDFNRLKSFLGKPPGPSGLHPNCPPTCP